MTNNQISTPGKGWSWLHDALLVGVLLIAAYFRFTGLRWGNFQNQHPDENFLSSVTLGVQPIGTPADQLGMPPNAASQAWRAAFPKAFPDCKAWGGYFNTACSPLNPQNRGYSFYVYGDLPLFIVRYLADWLNQSNLTLFGRIMSGVADLGTILLLYLIVKRVYGGRVAVLAAAFSALAVEQIQQSHFYTTDNFVSLFMFLTLYFAVLIATGKWTEPADEELTLPDHPVFDNRAVRTLIRLGRNPLTYLTLGFGVALGMAAASKINAAVLAVTLPVALAIRYYNVDRSKSILVKRRKSHPAGRPPVGEFISKIFVFLVIGAVLSIASFRIFQPYAFSGLGFNPQWLSNIREYLNQASPDADLPWSLQWTRRTHLYSFQNLTTWGLGLPLGILAWVGFLWMGWRLLRGEWRQHLLLWSWTGIYFVWQSLAWNPTMRYQLPIYPLLAMMAAWLVFGLPRLDLRLFKRIHLGTVLGWILGLAGLGLTAAWAYAFLQIYVRPEPRSAATDWIFQNIPGPINLSIQTPAGTPYHQPVPFPDGNTILPDTPFGVTFTAQADGVIDQVFLPYVGARGSALTLNLTATLWQNLDDPQPLSVASLSVPDAAGSGPQKLNFIQPPALTAQQTYYLKIELTTPDVILSLCDPLQLSLQTPTSLIMQSLDVPAQCSLGNGGTYLVQFAPQADGALAQILLANLADTGLTGVRTLSLLLAQGPNAPPEQVFGRATATADFNSTRDPRGAPATLRPDRSVPVKKGQTYYLELGASGGALTLSASNVVNETDYDYTLPFRTGVYDPYGGIYRGGLNLQVYWDDNADKLSRLETTLDQGDYLFLPTAHQYSQITRVPERYPLTTVYYRELLGCPPEKEIDWCYRMAVPGMFHGSLGYDLVAVFTSYPSLGPLQINDQSSEEAFTFYDHPKTMIFKKSANYDPARVRAVLGAVDYSTATHLTPRQVNSYKNLMLSPAVLAIQQAGGTWSQLFDWNALQNKYPVVGLVVWYLVIFILGLLAYPLVRAALPGLPDHGYPLARIAGLVLWAWLSWLAGSLGLTYSRTVIGIALGLIALLGVLLAFRQRDELRREWRDRKRYFLLVEGLFLVFFLLDLGIRLGNPDLWHPSKGGERPMNFAYFNAILKSTTFPPYDPWFAGGYINYYYYGYVIVGTPVKLLGIVPSVAYDFILPTLFAMLAVSAFSVGWNILAGAQRIENVAPSDESALSWWLLIRRPAFFAGIFSSTGMVLLGNLGVVRLLYQGFQKIAAPGGVIDNVGFFQRLAWAGKGFVQSLLGANLPYGPGDWYWFPSRALPDSSGGPITEFPLFTFIYSDLHAHMIALSVTVLAIAWALSVILARAKWKSRLDLCLGFFLGGLVIGALKPTNTWDIYTYLLLAIIVLAYTLWRYADVGRLPSKFSPPVKRFVYALGAIVALAGLSILLYQPFSHWFYQAYTSVQPWKGGRSDLTSYLTHWGVFLFFIVSWMVWETREWMAATPASSLAKLKPYLELIVGVVVVLFLFLVLQQVWVTLPTQDVPWRGITILWLALPLAVWAGVLILRPGLSDIKRLVLFMVGTGLVITMFVELVVVTGDIGRQNTVFKFYMQAWIMLGLSAAAALAWLLTEVRKWVFGWRLAWQVASMLLVAGAVLFLLLGGMGKIRDRMATNAPHTLDTMTFMAYSTYSEFGRDLNLSEDYRAIRWMQQNVQGSPVIAEAAAAGVQYTWLSRFSIYTGLPDVVGWQWHQQQQRVLQNQVVIDRGAEEDDFYATTDVNAARAFLSKFNVRYIVVGQLERAKYAPGAPGGPVPADGPDGLAKFEQYDGALWQSVYRDGQTVIYKVLP